MDRHELRPIRRQCHPRAPSSDHSLRFEQPGQAWAIHYERKATRTVIFRFAQDLSKITSTLGPTSAAHVRLLSRQGTAAAEERER